VFSSRGFRPVVRRVLRERIFEPLGMRDTGFDVPAAKLDRFATSYSTDPDTGALALHDEPLGVWSRAPDFPSGAGGLVSTVDDFAAFSQMLLSNGAHDGVRILSDVDSRPLTTDQLTAAQKAVSGLVPGWFDSHGWGFGVASSRGGSIRVSPSANTAGTVVLAPRGGSTRARG